MHDHADQTSLARGLTLPLCFFAALLEGASMQVANATMPKLALVFPMAADMKTAVLSASVVGIMVGALLGGRMADYLGRKRVLILSMLFYGLFLLLTTLAVYPEQLVLLRLLTGIGIGSSMVSGFSLLTENSDPERRGLTLAAMYCGMPLGSGLVRLTALIGIGDWRAPFYVVGGIALLTAPLIARQLTESSGFPLRADAPRPLAITSALFAGGRAFTTVLLWAAFGFMLLAVYLLQGWLPILLVSRGLSRSDAATVQICYNSGAALGALLLGTLLDLPHRWATVAVNYALMMCGLMALLYLEPRLEPMGAAGFLLGASMVGGQATIYILASSSFDRTYRGTGLGSTIALGRTGSLVGPLVALGVLDAGVLPVQVLQTLALLVAASGVAALFLVLPREQTGSMDGAGQRAEL